VGTHGLKGWCIVEVLSQILFGWEHFRVSRYEFEIVILNQNYAGATHGYFS
jgi:hypothetical protein